MGRLPKLVEGNLFRRTGRLAWLPLTALPRVFQQASSAWIDDNGPRLGAAVAFYTLLSLAPLFVLAVALAALVYGQEAAQGRLASETRVFVGADLARTIQQIIRGAYKPGTGVIATFAGLATLAFAASSIFIELHDAMNTIWNVRLPLNQSNVATALRLLRDRFYSFLTVVATGFFLLLSLVWNAWLATIRVSVPRPVSFLLSFLMITVLFAVLYKIVPDVTLRWSDVALGAALTALLFMIGKQLMALYFAYADLRSTYGVAGSPIVVLLWVYYSAQLFFWGAEFSKVYTRTLGTREPASATPQGQPPFAGRRPRRSRASGEDGSN